MNQEAFRKFCHEQNTLNPNFTSNSIKIEIFFKLVRGSSQYNDSNICWKIWGSNLGSSNRNIS